MSEFENTTKKNNPINPKSSGLFTNYIYKSIPLAFDDSMSYLATLNGLLAYIENTLIPAINDDIEAVNNLQDLYTELKSYVDHYFDSLDIQAEIDSKLDEMVETGELQSIIGEYLEQYVIYHFNTIEDLENSENISNNVVVETLGYYSINDGGKGKYKVRTKTQDDVVDNGSIIALADNTLIAELLIDDGTVNAMSFGLSEDEDCSVQLSNCINFASQNNYNIFIPAGTYSFDYPIVVPSSLSIYGISSNIFDDYKGTILHYLGTGTFLTLNHYANLSDIELLGEETNNGITMGACKLNNVNIKNFDIGVQLGTDLVSPCAYLENVFCYGCNLGFKLDSNYTDPQNKKYCQDTTLMKCRCNNCLNGYYINDYAIHMITINAEAGKSGGVPVELGANAKSCTILNSYLENNNVTKELVIDSGAKYNEISGSRYLGWISKIENNGDATNIITCPSISNQTVQFQHGKVSSEYLGITAKDDYSLLYGIEKTSATNINEIVEGVRYGEGTIFKTYTSNLVHRLNNFTARNRTNATISNISVTHTVTPNSISVTANGTQNITFNSPYFDTTANTQFIATALTNLNLVINFYKNDTYLVMHIYNPTNDTITSDPIPVTVLCWEQA